MDTLIAWIMRAIPFGTIIMYGAMGEIVTEKCGNLNLGVPGIMYLGGFAGFASAYLYENTAANPNMALCVVISLLCAFAASMLGGLIYSFLTISLRANQNVTGLALTTFGMGVANFFGVYILNGSTATQSMVYKTFQTKLARASRFGHYRPNDLQLRFHGLRRHHSGRHPASNPESYANRPESARSWRKPRDCGCRRYQRHKVQISGHLPRCGHFRPRRPLLCAGLQSGHLGNHHAD